MLQDMKQTQGRLINFATSDAVYPKGSERPFHCNIYKVSTDDFLNEHVRCNFMGYRQSAKRNRNETKRNQTKRNETKCNENKF